MTAADRALLRAVFRRGSRTFYLASRLFPAGIRDEVEELYALVRVADDCVDKLPQDPARLDALESRLAGGDAALAAEDRAIADAYRELAIRRGFDPAWTAAFFASMRADLSPRTYATLADTLAYVHGSAEVIGLMMARVMGADDEALGKAALLGRAFQYINMLRDVGADQRLGRTYIPAEILARHGLADLAAETARSRPAAFAALMRAELDRYRAWQREAEPGIAALPARCRPAVRAACAAFAATADRIEEAPLSVYDAPYKPSRPALLWHLVRSLR